MWVYVKDVFNDKMKERYPAYNGREMHLLKYKWDGLLRAARKHNLWLLGQNGTRGGSGNGRSVSFEFR